MFWSCEERVDPLWGPREECMDPVWAPREDGHYARYDVDEPPDPCPLCGSTARSCPGYAVCWRCWTLVAWRSWWKWRGVVGELPATLISAFWLGPWNVVRLHYDPDLMIVLSYKLLSRWSFGQSLLLATFKDACLFAAGAFLVPWTRRQARTVQSLQCFDIPILFADEILATPPEAAKPRFRTWLQRALGVKGLRRLKRALKGNDPSVQWIWGTQLLTIAYNTNAKRDKESETCIETLLANVCAGSRGALCVQSFEIQETTLQILQHQDKTNFEARAPAQTELANLHQWVQRLGHKYLLYVAALGSKSEAIGKPNNANVVDSATCILQCDSAWWAQTLLQETLGKWGFILPRHG